MRERKYATNAERQAAYRWSLVPEKQIQADIVKLLETVGAAVYRIGTKRKRGDHQGTMQTPGIPDLVAFVRCQDDQSQYWSQVWIEVKRPRGRMSADQSYFKENAERALAAHIVGGVSEVLDWLKERGVVK